MRYKITMDRETAGKNSATNEFEYIFWQIFDANKIGLACTDDQHRLICANDYFTRNVIEGAFKSDTGNFSNFVRSYDENPLPVCLPLTSAIVLSKISFDVGSETGMHCWVAAPDGNTFVAPEVIKLKGLYYSFVNNTFEFIFTLSEDDKIIFCNERFATAFGFTNSQLAEGFHMQPLFVDEEALRLFKNELKIKNQILGKIIEFKTRYSQRIIGLVNCNVFSSDSGETVYNWTVLDISKNVEFERSLKAKNEELEKLNATMEKFLYSTSHDLRSPVSSILGLVNLMKLESQDKTLQDYIEKIEISAFKLDIIIRDLMGLTKTSYQRERIKKIELHQVIRNVIDKNSKEANFSRISFEVNAIESFPFYTDHERLEIILDNFVRNALHFSDVNKTHSFVRITATIKAEEIKIEILDNGIGIGKAHQTQIFNMFYKASNLSKGAGLGLYIVKESLQQLNGSVSVESEIGFGSLFRISIPNSNKGKLISRKMKLLASSEEL